ncbi:MAG: DUF6152 family protein [Gammaproteobacteria bacterium]
MKPDAMGDTMAEFMNQLGFIYFQTKGVSMKQTQHAIAAPMSSSLGFISLTCLIVVSLISLSVSAHHGPTTSPALYQTENLIRFEGEIIGVLWRNPHVRMKLAVLDQNGEMVEWELETTVPALLERVGITSDLIKVGDKVKAAGYLSMFKARSIGLRNLLLPDGREYAGARTELLWSTKRVARTVQRIDESKAEVALQDADGIYRVWSRWAGPSAGSPGPSRAGYDHLLTDKARAIKAAYSPVDHPVLNCGPRGMPELMLTPAPIEIVAGNDQIILHTMWPGPSRIIDMGGGSVAAALPFPKHLGRSVGVWEDENTLVVTTTDVDWPYFDRSGTPQSDQVTFVERFTMNEDRNRLDYIATATDPLMFSAPVELIYSWTWVPGEVGMENECVQWEDQVG